MTEGTPACAEPSNKYPEGRTGTVAGHQWHRKFGEPPCTACFNALQAYNKSRRPSGPVFEEAIEGLKCSRPTVRFPNGRTGTGAGYAVHRVAGETPCEECREARLIDRRSREPVYRAFWEKTPACERPTEKYPEGRTGTCAGYQAHQLRGETACPACLKAQTERALSWRYASADRLAEHRAQNNVATKKWREQHPDEARFAKHRVIGRNRALIQEAKNRPCTDCGVQYPYYVMEFDHLDAGTKEFNVSAGVTRASYERLLAEIAKCEVVCANCHAERTHQRKKRREEASTDVVD